MMMMMAMKERRSEKSGRRTVFYVRRESRESREVVTLTVIKSLNEGRYGELHALSYISVTFTSLHRHI